MSPETVEALSNVRIMLAAIAVGMILGRLTDLKFPWVKENKPRCKLCGEDVSFYITKDGRTWCAWCDRKLQEAPNDG